MEIAEIQQRWLAAKSGILRPLREEDLPLASDETKETSAGRWLCYICPCGGTDHVALRKVIYEGQTNIGLADILNCFVTRQQWVICVNSSAVIKNEEERFLRMLKNAGTTCRKVFKKMGVVDAAFFFLKDTHGIDREIAEMFA